MATGSESEIDQASVCLKGNDLSGGLVGYLSTLELGRVSRARGTLTDLCPQLSASTLSTRTIGAYQYQCCDTLTTSGSTGNEWGNALCLSLRITKG